MIQFKDFVPERTDPGGLFKQATYASFEAAVAEASNWSSQPAVQVINVETVVLPNIHGKYEEGSGDASLRTSADMASDWHQFVRVWYSTE